MMNQLHLSLVLLFLISNSCLMIQSQQPYIGQATNQCDNTNNSTSVLGYSCNGVNPSCQAYLTFRSQPPFNSVSSISTLLAADPSQVSQLNNVSNNQADATFETNKLVLVPINCSCSGPFYQSNTSYVLQNDDTYYTTANITFQGLSSCQALQAENGNLSTRNLVPGTRINVPLRCACPTRNQTDDGVKYLLSYLVTFGDSVYDISTMFNVDTGKTLQANGLSEEDFTIYPFTTLLVPLQNPPSISQIIQPPPPPPSSNAPSPKGSSNKAWIYALVGTLGGIALISVSGLLVYWFCFRGRKRTEKDPVVVSESFDSIEKAPEKNGMKSAEDEMSSSFWDSLSSFAQSLNLYSYEELRLATDNFGPSCLIGGSVYRGMIKGDYAAMKKMSGDVSEEINLLNKLNHLNLIRLSGVCFNDGYWYMVYEYAANGALSDWIYGKNLGKEKEMLILDWKQRVQIGLDVATGLNYLHSYTSPPHVHKDLNCSNVLLDGDFRAKISNFGLARSAEGPGEGGGQFALTRHIIGTKGYMAPEYLENGLISTKLDVYSFGVLLLEILTGKEVAVLYESVKIQSLAEILIPVLNEKDGIENLSQIMDSSLGGNYPSELAILLIKLIDSCLKKDPSARPSMHEIVQTFTTTVTATTSWESKLSV
ncbi:hypothetical protein ACH5RR_014136 [Cinchona calisaya]|uniref:LysM domain receptor-like kinase 4 n=1 Tax=Cinchona calisaya TaxID=153742 RepID=A0ABD3A212_9GENT